MIVQAISSSSFIFFHNKSPVLNQDGAFIMLIELLLHLLIRYVRYVSFGGLTLALVGVAVVLAAETGTVHRIGLVVGGTVHFLRGCAPGRVQLFEGCVNGGSVA